MCLSFTTRYHLRILKKGQEEGEALQVIRSLLAVIVQLNPNSLRCTNLMQKYLDKYEKLMPPCVPYHYVFNGLQTGRSLLRRGPRVRFLIPLYSLFPKNGQKINFVKF